MSRLREIEATYDGTKERTEIDLNFLPGFFVVILPYSIVWSQLKFKASFGAHLLKSRIVNFGFLKSLLLEFNILYLPPYVSAATP